MKLSLALVALATTSYAKEVCPVFDEEVVPQRKFCQDNGVMFEDCGKLQDVCCGRLREQNPSNNQVNECMRNELNNPKTTLKLKINEYKAKYPKEENACNCLTKLDFCLKQLTKQSKTTRTGAAYAEIYLFNHLKLDECLED